MVNVIGIKFQNNGKMYYFNAGELEAHVGQYVIVDTVQGPDLAEVVMGCRTFEEEELSAPLKSVIRMATAQDIQHATDNRMKEREAYTICQRKIGEHQLEMKLVSVEYAFDNSKILFYFTANGRVDFRALVKDLASVFKTRIELRQIGVRDEARMLGGLGPCGRQICCGAFLTEFQPVSIKMAKEQSLSLNPTKISGVCGRLMCCLKYEQDHYEKTRKMMPRIGREVTTPDGEGLVTSLNIVKETVTVRITKGDESEIREYPLESLSHDGVPFVTDCQEAPVQETAEATEAEEPAETGAEETEEFVAVIPEQPAPEQMKSGETDEEQFRENRKHRNREGENGRRERRDNRNHGGNDRKREDNGPRPAKNSEKHDRTADGGHKPGEPVRRVNPNRKRFDSNESQEQAKNTVTAPDTTNMPAEGSKTPGKKNNWADALEKAIRAADGNS